MLGHWSITPHLYRTAKERQVRAMLLHHLLLAFQRRYQSMTTHHLSLLLVVSPFRLLSKGKGSAQILAHHLRQEEVEALPLLLQENPALHRLHHEHLKRRPLPILDLQLPLPFHQLHQDPCLPLLLL